MLTLDESPVAAVVLVLVMEPVVELSRSLHPVPRVELPLLTHAVAHHLLRGEEHVCHAVDHSIHHKPHIVTYGPWLTGLGREFNIP